MHGATKWLIRAGVATLGCVLIGVARPSTAYACAICRYVPQAICEAMSSGGWKWCNVSETGNCDHGPACEEPEPFVETQPDAEGFTVELTCNGRVSRVLSQDVHTLGIGSLIAFETTDDLRPPSATAAVAATPSATAPIGSGT
jgi:hypothetical protein